ARCPGSPRRWRARGSQRKLSGPACKKAGYSGRTPRCQPDVSSYDDGKPILAAPGKDQVLIVDLADPEAPKIVATLPLKNSVVGPPVNVDIDPTGTVALVADSVDVVKDGEALKQVPDNKIYVIDLKAEPPKLAATISAGKQP